MSKPSPIKFDAPFWNTYTFKNEEEVKYFFSNVVMNDRQLEACGVLPYDDDDCEDIEDEDEDYDFGRDVLANIITIHNKNEYVDDDNQTAYIADIFEVSEKSLVLDKDIWHKFPITFMMVFENTFDRMGNVETMIFTEIVPSTIDDLKAKMATETEPQLALLDYYVSMEEFRDARDNATTDEEREKVLEDYKDVVKPVRSSV